jgi:hypothetical protein
MLTGMKPITTSIFTFSDVIDGGYVYVDKTARLYDLVRPYKGVYFLSRPRRFGKSLTISTWRPFFGAGGNCSAGWPSTRPTTTGNRTRSSAST